MGFYIRKSFGLGPLRLNLSRSGLGASFGVTGARVGLGPRGAHVHAGRGGLYYRQSLSPRRPRSTAARDAGARVEAEPAVDLTEIESAATAQLVDASAADLLEELSRVQARPQLAPLVVVGLPLVVIGLLAGGAPGWAYVLAGLAGLAGLLWARHLDVTRGTAVLHYDLEPDAEHAFSQLVAAFEQLAACRAVWHVEAAGRTASRKRQAGAGALQRRRPIAPRRSRPPRVECNLAVPTLPAGRQTLYFFPDRVLVYDRRRVGAVPYQDLQVGAEAVRLIEDETVPSDADITDRTWRHINKDGGPDRRFRDNPELPVVLYGRLHLTSSTGLNELFQCSREGAAAAVAEAVRGQRAACK